MATGRVNLHPQSVYQESSTMLLLMLSRLRVLVPALLLTCFAVLSSAQDQSWIEAYRAPVRPHPRGGDGDDFAWQRLAYLTDTFGNRLSGIAVAEDAIEWAAAEMEKDGLENRPQRIR